MKIMIKREFENEFLSFKPFFAYCFTTEKNKNKPFVKYHYNMRKIPFGHRIKFIKEFNKFLKSRGLENE